MNKKQFEDFFEEFTEDCLEDFDDALKQTPAHRDRGLAIISFPVSNEGQILFMCTGDKKDLTSRLKELVAWLEGRLHNEAPGRH